jgi:hypothetical protein
MNQELEVGEEAVFLFALAARLEGEGQLNIAKLLRAGTESVFRREAVKLTMPSDPSQLAGEIMRGVAVLSALEADQALVAAIQHGASAMAEDRLPLFDEAPNAYVCRTCGHLELNKPVVECPGCNAHPETFLVFLPTYWLQAFDPFQALANLRQTPFELENSLQGQSEAALTNQPQDGGWSIQQTLVHLRDAQGLLDFRVNLMLEQENPTLESQAVFDWVSREAGQMPHTRAIFQGYLSSRRQTLKRLESIPLASWWRSGQHQEFGPVTILQQASYFAAHELTHLPQIARLRVE